ncbi:MAG: class I SAM-dependent methyltransferase [Pseudomonadota bacterium]
MTSKAACPARHREATLIAIDRHAPYLAELQRRAEAVGIASCVAWAMCDMADLRFPDASFDLLWCQGAVHAIGWRSTIARLGNGLPI